MKQSIPRTLFLTIGMGSLSLPAIGQKPKVFPDYTYVYEPSDSIQMTIFDDAGSHVALTRLPMRLPCGEQEEQREEAPKESGRVVVGSHSGIGEWGRGFYSSSIGV